MAEKIECGNEDWDAIYEYERCRQPVRQLCQDVHRHFTWQGADSQYKTPRDWLKHYASCFHFSDAEIWAARTTGSIPCAEGVYFLFDGDACIYVGQTHNFWDRFEQHKRNRMRWTSHVYMEVPKIHAPAVEAYYIRRLRPALNATSPSLSLYSNIVEKLGLDRAA